MLRATALAAAFIAVSSCSDSTPKNSLFIELPGLTTVIPAEGSAARAPVSGEIAELPDAVRKAGTFGKSIAIKTSQAYTTYVAVRDYLLDPIESLYDSRVSSIVKVQKENR